MLCAVQHEPTAGGMAVAKSTLRGLSFPASLTDEMLTIKSSCIPSRIFELRHQLEANVKNRQSFCTVIAWQDMLIVKLMAMQNAQ